VLALRLLLPIADRANEKWEWVPSCTSLLYFYSAKSLLLFLLLLLLVPLLLSLLLLSLPMESVFLIILHTIGQSGDESGNESDDEGDEESAWRRRKDKGAECVLLDTTLCVYTAEL
jgi:hypothetical protein